MFSNKVLPATCSSSTSRGLSAASNEGLGSKSCPTCRDPRDLQVDPRLSRMQQRHHVDERWRLPTTSRRSRRSWCSASTCGPWRSDAALSRRRRNQQGQGACLGRLRPRYRCSSWNAISAANLDRSLLREPMLMTSQADALRLQLRRDTPSDDELRQRRCTISWRHRRPSSSTPSSSRSRRSSTTTTRRAPCSREMGVTTARPGHVARVGFDTLGLQTFLAAVRRVTGVDRRRDPPRGCRRDPRTSGAASSRRNRRTTT